jgi:outer membrane protein assembly factor BamB
LPIPNPVKAEGKVAMGGVHDLLRRLVFVGFNSRVAALDRQTGDVVWSWKSPQGSGQYVGILLDGDRLIVSIQGYTFCLDPLNGGQIWFNPLKGFGVGIPSLASVNGNTSAGAAQMLLEEADASSAAAASTAATSG